MNFEHNFPLQALNTFGLASVAEKLVRVRSVEELQEVLAAQIRPVHVLGGGSNILLTLKHLPGLVIKNEIPGIQVESETASHAIVEVGGGTVWHELVEWSIGQGLGGLENLSLIPGCVGAAPIQNIGAYGVELKDSFHRLEAVEIATGDIRVFDLETCQFGYRDSIFKREEKGRHVIVKVYFKLSKHPLLNTNYGDIQRTLAEMGIEHPGIREVSEAVCKIRRSKLPDPAEIGNAGSFFKNPEVTASRFAEIATKWPDMAHYRLPNGDVKIPAGWLIEQAGWKGWRAGDAGCHARQALVLVNYGHATGTEILALAHQIQASVLEKYGINLSPEVNIW